jgi:hypothetical protein
MADVWCSASVARKSIEKLGAILKRPTIILRGSIVNSASVSCLAKFAENARLGVIHMMAYGL